MTIISGDTILLGVIGNPISHSFSPLMHNAVLEDQNLNYVYVPLLIDSDHALGAFLTMLRGSNFAGVNVTVPYKEKVIPFLDQLDESASSVGAVNTIIHQEGQLIGYNTDGDGFLLSVKHDLGYDVTGKKVVVCGAGGSAKSIAVALLKSGITQLVILNRTLSRSQELVAQLELLGFDTPVLTYDYQNGLTDHLVTVMADANFVVNTTSLGMTPHVDTAFFDQYTWVNSGHVCYDIVYNPVETRFVKEVSSLGAVSCTGLGMLIGQGCLAFTLFTGNEIGFEIMKKRIEKEI